MSTLTPHAKLVTVIEKTRREGRFRARRMLFTLLCEAVAPHGGTFRIADLAKMAAPFGIGSRRLRTLVYRLCKEGWLSVDELERRGHYTLTERSMQTFRNAFQRSFDLRSTPWNGEMLQIVTNVVRLDGRVQRALTKALVWRGFGTVSSGVFVHPAISENEANALLSQLGVLDRVITMRVRVHDVTNGLLPKFVESCWDLPRLRKSYRAYVTRFTPVYRALKASSKAEGYCCFVARMMAVNEYWSLCLRVPYIPEELLPPEWEGKTARDLCRDLMLLTEAGTSSYVQSIAS